MYWMAIRSLSAEEEGFSEKKVTPLVGDDVVYQADNDKEGYILEIKDRFNESVQTSDQQRGSGGSRVFGKGADIQHVAFGSFFSAGRGDIRLIICITKMDLVDDDALKEQIHQYAEDYREHRVQRLFDINESGRGIEDIIPHFQDKITVFAGQSGVGKASLLNGSALTFNLKPPGFPPTWEGENIRRAMWS